MRIIRPRGRLLCTAAALTTALVTATLAEAQSGLPEPGDQTRVRHPNGQWQAGVVLSADAGSVRLVRAGTSDTVSYAIGPRDRWEVAHGSHIHPVRGLLIGAGAGALLGGVTLSAIARDGGYSYGPEDVLIGAGVGAAVGAGLGALIGALSRTPRWDPVIRPGGGVGAGLSLDF